MAKSHNKKSDPNYRIEARKIFDSEKNSEITDEQYKKAVNIIETIPFDLIELIKNISDCRNSINHFGFSNIGQYTYISLENNLKKYRDEFKKIMERMRETNPQE